MPKRIGEDHADFRRVISGRTREELRRLIKTKQIVKSRPNKNGRMTISIPQIDQPIIVHGPNPKGVGRGPGKPGDMIKGPDKGDGKGDQAGEGHQEGILISVDMDDVLKMLGEDLALPPMKPKPTQTFEEVKVIYNHISKMGPESLRHTRRTMLEAIKRLAASDQLNKPVMVPGSKVPMSLIIPENQDKRYKQYREITIPSSNAVIFFARDCSGSMDSYKCDIVSDMSWWIDVWIRKFYEKVERVYMVHDDEAEEVDEKKFYSYRDGGGTACSSAFKLIGEMIENKFPPQSYNIYIFYFTDGDNMGYDNEKLLELLGKFDPKDVNLIGITQVMPYGSQGVKELVDEALAEKTLNSENIRTALIGKDRSDDKKSIFGGYGSHQLSEEDRDNQIFDAIKKLLSKEPVDKE